MDLNKIVNELIEFDESSDNKIVNRNNIIKFINEVRNVLFLGYNESVTNNIDNYLLNKLNIINELLKNILISINYDEISSVLLTESFLNKIPMIKKQLNGDLKAFSLSDPAVCNEQEIIHCYPGFYAICLYRIANVLNNLEVIILPRIICEHAHSKTGIDIHPGATIGTNFFIDHGTGVVIGQTSIIGNNVKIYQGVTLGAISLNDIESLKNVKRHPTIKDNVIIYSNTSILGGQTVIGEGSVIGCNLFITKSIEKDSKIVFNIDSQQMLNKKVG